MACNSGTHYEDVYEFRIVDGVETLVKTGETNVFDNIQSFADLGDINVQIQRFMNGDVDALNVSHGEYFDATMYPKTYAELYDRVKAAETVYANMPDVVKEKYKTPQEFFENYGNEDFVNFAKAFEASAASSGSDSEVNGNSEK